MATRKARVRFRTKLLRPAEPAGAAGCVRRLPAAASARLPSRGLVTVEGTLDGAPFTATLQPDGEGGHWLKVEPALREAAGADPGATVTLEIAPVEKEPEPEVPEDLRAALEAHPAALATWKDITPVARRVWLQPPSTRLDTKPPMQAWGKPALRASTGPGCTGRRAAAGRAAVGRAGTGAGAAAAASGLDSSAWNCRSRSFTAWRTSATVTTVCSSPYRHRATNTAPTMRQNGVPASSSRRGMWRTSGLRKRTSLRSTGWSCTQRPSFSCAPRPAGDPRRTVGGARRRQSVPVSHHVTVRTRGLDARNARLRRGRLAMERM